MGIQKKIYKITAKFAVCYSADHLLNYFNPSSILLQNIFFDIEMNEYKRRIYEERVKIKPTTKIK